MSDPRGHRHRRQVSPRAAARARRHGRGLGGAAPPARHAGGRQADEPANSESPSTAAPASSARPAPSPRSRAPTWCASTTTASTTARRTWPWSSSRAKTSATRLQRLKTLPLPAVAAIVVQLSKALRKAHEAGIVHRDLKPANVFLVREEDAEVVKVLDFGVAKMTGLGEASESTQTGVVVGSVHYMSPEQARGARDIDHRSDLWAIGVIAYRAVTGRLPFPGAQIGDVIVKFAPSRCRPPVGHARSRPRRRRVLRPRAGAQSRAAVPERPRNSHGAVRARRRLTRALERDVGVGASAADAGAGGSTDSRRQPRRSTHGPTGRAADAAPAGPCSTAGSRHRKAERPIPSRTVAGPAFSALGHNVRWPRSTVNPGAPAGPARGIAARALALGLGRAASHAASWQTDAPGHALARVVQAPRMVPDSHGRCGPSSSTVRGAIRVGRRHAHPRSPSDRRVDGGARSEAERACGGGRHHHRGGLVRAGGRGPRSRPHWQRQACCISTDSGRCADAGRNDAGRNECQSGTSNEPIRLRHPAARRGSAECEDPTEVVRCTVGEVHPDRALRLVASVVLVATRLLRRHPNGAILPAPCPAPPPRSVATSPPSSRST